VGLQPLSFARQSRLRSGLSLRWLKFGVDAVGLDALSPVRVDPLAAVVWTP
jgi:hypothetical protein